MNEDKYMDKINELKEIIINLKMELIEERIPKGHCPFTYYRLANGKNIDCNIGCEKCRNLFIKSMEKHIRKKVAEL